MQPRCARSNKVIRKEGIETKLQMPAYITLHENWSCSGMNGTTSRVYLAEISEYAFDFADNNDISGNDWIHRVVFRLKSDMIRFLIESLDCRT